MKLLKSFGKRGGGGATISDHNLITFVVRGAGRAPANPQHQAAPLPVRFKMTRSRFSTLRTRILAGVKKNETTLECRQDIENAVSSLTNTIMEACESTLGDIRPRRKVTPWWSKKIDNLKRVCYRARRAMQRSTDPNERSRKAEAYRGAKKTYQAEICQAKATLWRRFVEEEVERDIWKAAARIKRKGKTAGEVATTSEKWRTTTWTEAAEHLLGHFVRRDDPAQDTAEQAATRTAAAEPPEEEETEEVTEGEIEHLIKTLKNRVTPGLDRIENEVLKAACDVLAPQLTGIFRRCLALGIFPSMWKKARVRTLLKDAGKDKGDPSSYRPICLLSALSKLLERVLRARILKKADLHPRQYGFRQGRNTTDALEDLVEMCRRTKVRNIVIIMVDIAAAFDELWWPHVLACLKKMGCSKEVYQTIQDYFREREVTLIDGIKQHKKAQERGCPQGSVLGPTLWNVAFNDVIKEIDGVNGCTPIVYADDLTIVVGGDTMEGVQTAAQECMERAYKWCNKVKMRISSEKTRCLVAKRARDPASKIPPTILDPSGAQLEFVDSAKLLGVHIDVNIRFKTHCEKIGDKAKSSFSRFRAVARAGWGWKGREMLKIYRATVVPIMTYAAGAWWKYATGADQRKLQTAQRATLLVATRAYRTTSTPALLVIAGVPPIQHEMEKAELSQSCRKQEEITLNNQRYNPAEKEKKELKTQLEEAQTRLQQKNWDEDTRGRITHAFFPSIKGRKEADWINPSYYLTQYLGGHGNFKDKLRKFSLVRSNKCKCGAADTWEHTFNECVLQPDRRNIYAEKVTDVGLGWPLTPAQSVTEVAMPLTAEYIKLILKEKEVWDRPP